MRARRGRRRVDAAFLLVLALPLAACGAGTERGTAAGDAARAAEPIVAGLYILGDEVHTFQPCGGTEVYWVVGPDSVVRDLRDRYRQWAMDSGAGPYTPVYLRVRGNPVAGRGEGYALLYDGLFGIDEVVELSPEIETGCVLPEISPAP